MDREAPREPGNIHDQLLRSFLANWPTQLLRATRGRKRATHKPRVTGVVPPRWGLYTYTWSDFPENWPGVAGAHTLKGLTVTVGCGPTTQSWSQDSARSPARPARP